MRILLVGLLWVGSLPLSGQASVLPEAPVPVAVAGALPQKDAQWDRVEALVPGESIELRDRATGVRTECVLAYASASALGCDSGGPYDPLRRVVYPKAGIDRVWVVRLARGASPKVVLIGAGIGAVLGGLAGANSNASVTVRGAALGSLLGAGIAGIDNPFNPRIHRSKHLIYKNP